MEQKILVSITACISNNLLKVFESQYMCKSQIVQSIRQSLDQLAVNMKFVK